MLTLRPVTSEDIPQLLALAMAASTAAAMPLGGLSRERLQQQLVEVARQKAGIVGVVEGQIIGGVAGVMVPTWYTEDTLFFLQLCFIAPAFRRWTAVFFRQLEQAVRRTTITQIVVSVPMTAAHDRLERWWRMAGYRRLETHMMKAVPHD